MRGRSCCWRCGIMSSMQCPLRCGRGRCLLPRSSVGCVFTLLSATHEGFDKVDVMCNDSLIDVIRLKVSKESKPGWVYTRRREPFLHIVAHMVDVHEGSRGWARDKRLVDGTSFRYTLLLCGCCGLCVCCVTESVGVARIRRTTYV